MCSNLVVLVDEPTSLVFGTYVFTMAGISDSFEQQVGLSASSLALAPLNGALLTKIGSRCLRLSLSLVIYGICNAVMAIVYTATPGCRAAGIVMISSKHLVGTSLTPLRHFPYRFTDWLIRNFS